MKIEILGAGGAIPVPRPFCDCAACEEARLKGAPYTRYGPSLFIHDIGLLIDTPEEIGIQLNRARIMRVPALTFSHWHPDHTSGLRVFEANYNSRKPYQHPPDIQTTQVFLAENVARTFTQYHDLQGRLDYLAQPGVFNIHTVSEGESFALAGVTITPIVLAEQIACGFVVDWWADDKNQTPRRVVICMDETFAWQPPESLGPLDLIIMPAGIFEHHPLTGQRRIAENHPLLKREATFAQTLDVLRRMRTVHHLSRAVFIHLGEPDGLTRAEYTTVADAHAADPSLPPLQFAFDSLVIDV